MNEDIGFSIQDFLLAIWRRKIILILVSLLTLIVGLALISRIPVVYRSSGLILVEQQEIPTQWVNSTVVSFADERIQAIGQRVLTTENLWRIIEKFDMFPDYRNQLTREELVGWVRGSFSVENVQASIRDRQSGMRSSATVAFRISYNNPDPKLARDVANELASLYLDENLRTRTQAAKDTRLFLEAEADRLEVELADIEEKISRFKEENFGALPEHQDINIQAYQRAEGQIEDIAQMLASLEERRIILESSIDSAERLLRAGQPSTAAAAAPPDPRAERLAELKSEFVNLQTRYSTDHPDLIRLEREIALLEGDVGDSAVPGLTERLETVQADLETARNRYSAEHPEVTRLQQEFDLLSQQVAETGDTVVDTALSVESELEESQPALRTDPAYIRLTTDLRSVLTEQETLRNRRVELRTKLLSLDEEINKSPEVEREYRALVRDHENIQSKYNDIREKQNSARVAESLELEQKAERFTLIEKPQVPDHPHSPNYKKLLMLVLGGSMASGVAAVFGLETLDGRIRNIRAMEASSGVPVLATVNVIMTPWDRRRRAMKIIFWLALIAAIIGILVYLAMINDISRQDLQPKVLLSQLRAWLETLNLPGY